MHLFRDLKAFLTECKYMREVTTPNLISDDLKDYLVGFADVPYLRR